MIMIDAPAKSKAAGIMMRAPMEKALAPLFVALDGLLFVTLAGKPLSKTLPSTVAGRPVHVLKKDKLFSA